MMEVGCVEGLGTQEMEVVELAEAGESGSGGSSGGGVNDGGRSLFSCLRINSSKDGRVRS